MATILEKSAPKIVCKSTPINKNNLQKDSADFWRRKNDFETEKFAIYDAKPENQLNSNVSALCTYEGKWFGKKLSRWWDS